MRHKVLLMARELGLGGTERQLAETALALDRSRFDPHVACFTDGGFRARELREAGVPIFEAGVRSLMPRSAVGGARRLGAYLRQQQIQLVHAFDVPADLFAVPVARFYRTPVVLSSMRAHRSLTPGATRQLLRATDRMVNAIVVNSRAVARELELEDGVAPGKMRLAYNGLDCAIFRPEGQRATLPWDSATAVIGIVCALRPEKGLGVLVEAFRKVRATRPGVKLLIVGSGPMLAELQSAAGEDCHFQPAERNVAPWLRAMDIFVLPSLSEALSNSLMEAMGCGCCPVASDTGGNPELVTPAETGMLFPVGDANALADRLARLLDEPDYRKTLANAACRKMHTEFTREIAAERMANIYQEFLG
ncbi:MAG: glycosyltransferase [Candidatus Solibacter sp.]